MIIKDPVKFPDNMSPNFKSFLKGLLNKTPSQRLTWPLLLTHPFIKETPQELAEREAIEARHKEWSLFKHLPGYQEPNANIVINNSDSN